MNFLQSREFAQQTAVELGRAKVAPEKLSRTETKYTEIIHTTGWLFKKRVTERIPESVNVVALEGWRLWHETMTFVEFFTDDHITGGYYEDASIWLGLDGELIRVDSKEGGFEIGGTASPDKIESMAPASDSDLRNADYPWEIGQTQDQAPDGEIFIETPRRLEHTNFPPEGTGIWTALSNLRQKHGI